MQQRGSQPTIQTITDSEIRAVFRHDDGGGRLGHNQLEGRQREKKKYFVIAPCLFLKNVIHTPRIPAANT